MEGFQLDEIVELELTPTRKTSRKPVKRKWREIEEIKDRRRLQKELMEIDQFSECNLDDIRF